MLRRFRNTAQLMDHPGTAFIRRAEDIFEIEGTDARHKCIVMKPQGIPLSKLQYHYANGAIPLPLLQSLIYHLLIAVHWLHADCRVIHCGWSSVCDAP